MSKKIRGVIIALLAVLLISLVGNFYLISNREIIRDVKITSAEEEYDQKYYSFDEQTKQTKLSIFNGALDARTSPSEIKYLMLKMADDLTDEEKDDAIAKYINHIQYFAQTYTNLATMYDNILVNLSKQIDFSKRDAAFEVSDRVLRNLLLEIWDSNMILYISENASENPSVIVDYTALKEDYGDFMTSTTSNYLDLKTKIIAGNVTDEDGNPDYDILESYIMDTYKFIVANPDFAIIEDVEYMYIVASKMYLGIYVGEADDVKYSQEDIARIKEFAAKHDNSPAAQAATMIVEDVEENETLSEDVFEEITEAFNVLIS